MIQILELFGGIGSPRCALRNIGIPVKAIDYVEIDENAVRSYNSMFKDELKYKTQNVVGYNLKPDILIHGSPCQDFSIAGQQKGADEGTETRSSLMWETIHIIQQMGEWKPQFVIWENVKNVLSKHMRINFNRYISEMEELGYTSNYEVLDAREFGLPQARERVFTISTLNGEKFCFNDLIRTQRTVVEATIDSTKTGFDRKELMVDARDLSSDGMTTAQYQAALVQRGIEKLREVGIVECLEATTLPFVNFAYKTDYDLGDIVTVNKKAWSIEIDKRITEIQEIYENGAFTIVPTFGDPLPETVSLTDQ